MMSRYSTTVVPTKSDSGVIFCLQLLCKNITLYTPLKLRESIDYLCINPILQIGLIHKRPIDYKLMLILQTKHDVTVTFGWQDSNIFHLYIFQLLDESDSFLLCLRHPYQLYHSH